MKVLLFITFLLLQLFGFSQHDLNKGVHEDAGTYINPIIDGKPLLSFIHNDFIKHLNDFNSSALYGNEGIFWVKFKVDTTGKLVKMDFSMGTPEKLNVWLLQLLNQTNGLWPSKKLNGNSVLSEYLVLTVHYRFLKHGRTTVVPLEPKYIQRFFNNTRKAEELTFLPNLTIGSGYDHDNVWR